MSKFSEMSVCIYVHNYANVFKVALSVMYRTACETHDLSSCWFETD